MKEIRLLKASEIECRVGQCGRTQNGKGWCSILLYKDARCDQRILDELFTPMGWQRRHEEVNGQVCCIIKIKDVDTNEWIEKEDVGTESNTEPVKGSFSDSFKRACFNLGIGRELYTAPKIFITLSEEEMVQKNGKWTVSPKCVFTVTEIGYDSERNIDALTIEDAKGVVRYKLGQAAPKMTDDSDDQMAYAMPAIQQARTQEELTRIYNDFPLLQKNQDFTNALNEKYKELNSAA